MTLTREKTARKEHSCWRCNVPIKPGERYRELKVPPDDPDAQNERWLRAAEHLSQTCYRYELEPTP